jgi:heterodisulfide reductase subunit A-like polyferredoxin
MQWVEDNFRISSLCHHHYCSFLSVHLQEIERKPGIMSVAKSFQLLVIGGGSGGLGMARRAAEFGVKVCFS